MNGKQCVGGSFCYFNMDVLNRKSYQFQEVFYGDISQTLQTQIYVYYDCTHREKFYSLSKIEDS